MNKVSTFVLSKIVGKHFIYRIFCKGETFYTDIKLLKNVLFWYIWKIRIFLLPWKVGGIMVSSKYSKLEKLLMFNNKLISAISEYDRNKKKLKLFMILMEEFWILWYWKTKGFSLHYGILSRMILIQEAKGMADFKRYFLS